ncbi:MAG TPA: glycoside hydrolase family 9 protein [Polyangia bacterium]|jgi:endoglucanase
MRPIVPLAVGLVFGALSGCGAGQAPEPKRAEAPALAAVEVPARPVVPTQMGTLTAGASEAAGNNILWNGTFDGPLLRPWSLAFDSPRLGRGGSADGELCLRIENGGAHSFDVALRQGPVAIAKGHTYQVRLRTHATAATRMRVRVGSVGAGATDYWTAEAKAGAEPTTYSGTFDGTIDDDGAELAFEFGGGLAGQGPLTVCLDDIELNDPAFELPAERTTRVALPKVRVNQVGYLPGFTKTATVVTAANTPLDWQLVSEAGQVAATGKTRPFGEDRSSGDHVQQIDFSSVRTPGKGWKLKVGDDESYPFTIGDDVYRKLKYDALSFFYLQRSGVDIKMPYAGSPAYERPAGHPGDTRVPCVAFAPCAYQLDVSGGWYDAGDHGKYVVSSAISVWTLQNEYEALSRFGSTAGDFADGKMNIPEAGNGRPDLLDEARFNLEFMLRMQVPAGQPHAGMAHQRIHGEKWSDLPTMPHEDTIKRFVHPVSTGATYDLAATAAQGARVWKKLDPAFAARCLTVAEAAFAAGKKNPVIFAEPLGQGGGAYGDGNLSDELYWAAAELFVTTGKDVYKDELTRSPFHHARSLDATGGTLGWDHVAALGKITLAEQPNGLGDAAVAEQRQALVTAADRFVATLDKRGYRMPAASDSTYIWGSNAATMNAGLVLGTAYFLTKDTKYANAAIDCMDYLLGRNPLAFSYVAGYGTHALRNPHHRVWAHQKNPKLPEAPPGAVSGGPNSMLQDPRIRKLGMSGCPPQTCYVDHIESYSTNEVAINWNAPLAWDAAFLDDLSRGARRP